ncbi:hypothetical protein ZIOFF_031480 [Zingiber officinale]|uniref:Cobalamin-independent methionine synthase MetE N-terminal domain-containing protein n=1 Tax=Zingiber officinale TaxID=94328 RepID=A0A8J5GEV0_ZINOF|nr:hypothetical protein ZIOFF_031480 [Zingiber officinale]
MAFRKQWTPTVPSSPASSISLNPSVCHCGAFTCGWRSRSGSPCDSGATLLDSSSFLHRDVVVVDPDNIFVDDITVPDSLDVAGVVFDDGSVGETQESLPLTIPPPAEPVEPIFVLSGDENVGETQEILLLTVRLLEPEPLAVQENATFTRRWSRVFLTAERSPPARYSFFIPISADLPVDGVPKAVDSDCAFLSGEFHLSKSISVPLGSLHLWTAFRKQCTLHLRCSDCRIPEEESLISVVYQFPADHGAIDGFVELQSSYSGSEREIARQGEEATGDFPSTGVVDTRRSGVPFSTQSLAFNVFFRKSYISHNEASHIVGYPCMGPERELQTALESFWSEEMSSDGLQNLAADLRSSVWKQMADAGIKYIPSNTFSYFDQMLDTTAMLGAVPERYNYTGNEIGFDIYCLMARGNASAVPAMKSMEKRQWFDTNNSRSYWACNLLLSEPTKGVEKSFCPLSLFESILPIYKEIIVELKAVGASWIQFDEPTLVLDLQSDKLHAFTEAYSKLESSLSGLNVLVETYFAGVPAEAYKIVTALKGVSGFGFDLVRGIGTIDLIKTEGFPAGKYLFAGVVNGSNIWANDLESSLKILKDLEDCVDKDKLVVSTSCSLMHIAVDVAKESKLDSELKSWLAFAAQKVIEVNALASSKEDKSNEHIHYSSLWEDKIQKQSDFRDTITGFTYGWLIMVHRDHVYLMDPITHVSINLPSIPSDDIDYWNIRGMSSSPSSLIGDFMIIMIFSDGDFDSFLIFASIKR